MYGIAVGVDGRLPHRAALVAQVARFHGRSRAAPHCLFEGAIGVVDKERDISHGVAVASCVLGDCVAGIERAREQQPRLSLSQGVRSAIPLSGFQTRIGDLRKSERLTVEVRRLPGISHPKFYVMNGSQLQRIVAHASSF